MSGAPAATNLAEKEVPMLARFAWPAALSVLVIGAPAAAHPNHSVDVEAAQSRAEAQTTLVAIEGLVAHVRSVLSGARGRRAPTEVACADSSLSRADVALRSARDHALRAADAWIRSDVVVARWEMVRLSARREHARKISKEADACVAQAQEWTAVPNTTSVRVVVDPGMPADAVLFGDDRR